MIPSSFTKTVSAQKGADTALLGSSSEHIDVHSRSGIILRRGPLPCIQHPRWEKKRGRKAGGGEGVTQMGTSCGKGHTHTQSPTWVMWRAGSGSWF